MSFGLKNRGDLPTVVEDEFENLLSKLGAFMEVAFNEDGSLKPASPELALVPIGGMQMWPTNAAPTNWLICDGAAVSRVTYKRLFTVLGISYGSGDGVLTFNLPNLASKFPMGGSPGSTGGASSHTHTGPAHTHTGPAHTHAFSGITGLPNNSFDVDSGSGSLAAADNHSHAYSGTTDSGGTGTTGSGGTGSTGSTSSLPPYVTVQFIIFAGGN